MRKRPYLKNDKEVSILGFGAWPLGNTSHGITMSDQEGIALVKEAVACGINFFDTAPNYALGRSETLLGKALVGIREHVVINSKFGHHVDDTLNFNESLIESSIRSSLHRLQTSYLDSVILHNPPLHVLKGETSHFVILEQLKQSGVIRGYGVSIDTLQELECTLKYLNVDVIELLFNVFSQSTRHCLTEIKKRNIALIIKVPLDSGWLTGTYTKDTLFTGIKSRWSDKDKARRHDLVLKLKALLGSDKLSKDALGFIWSYDAVSTVIPGIRTKEQLYEHVSSEKALFHHANQKTFNDFYDTYIHHEPLPW